MRPLHFIMYKVILYYNFGKTQEVDRFCKYHLQKCKDLDLKGRVYLAMEGINGTLAGTVESIDAYKEYLCSFEQFKNTSFKEDLFEEIPFDRLFVKVKSEIVVLKADDEHLDITQEKGEYLEPEEWRKVLESDEDYYLIDVRNDYESAVGYFEGAMKPPVRNFYDFPKWLEEENLDKDKKVLMYCTGGIRCEKFSVYMNRKGYKDVKQLHGGIIRYAKEQGGKHFKGKCFVFDDRLVVPVNDEEKEPIAKCAIMNTPCDQYINCANMDCNRLFICSPEGAEKMQGCCCEECMNASHRRPFDKETLYRPFRRWYQYFEVKKREAVADTGVKHG